MLPVVLSFVVLAATIATLAHIITRQDGQVRHLPKILWIILVIVVPIIGMVLWWTIGRERDAGGEWFSFGDPRRSEAARPRRSVDDRPVVIRAAIEDDDIDAQVEREIEFHENEARIRRLEAQLKQKRDAGQ